MRNLTRQELIEVARSSRLELARRHYADYCRLVHHGSWVEYPVHKLICTKLEEVLAGRCRRLIISMPPRHGKSQTVSETFPSYFLLRNPDKKVIVTSKDDELATRFGLYNRRKVEEFGAALFGITLAGDQKSKTLWNLDGHEGGMLSAPIMGGITGNGAHLLIIDDPIKNRQEADSATMRQKVIDEYRNTLLTRLERDAAVIVIMTRWHEDDLAGRILSEESGWEVLSIPCVAESENDPLGREPGDTLCPELGFDSAWAEERKTAVGTRVWEALYQQHPSPESGGIFKREWFRRYEHLPESEFQWTQSWDLSFKDSDKSDYVAGGVWAKQGANHYLAAIVKERLDFTGTERKIQVISEAYPQALRKLIEDKANGPAIINSLRSKLPGIIPITPKDSKQGRAYAVSPMIEAGNVYVPLGKAGDDFIDECVAFPFGAHDDQVDQMTQYLAQFIVNRAPARAGRLEVRFR